MNILHTDSLSAWIIKAVQRLQRESTQCRHVEDGSEQHHGEDPHPARDVKVALAVVVDAE